MQVSLNILEEENLYYFYHNWQAGQTNKIHRGSCGECKYGTGKQKNVDRGRNGVWLGPFSTLDLCHNYIAGELNLQPVEPHNCCN
ncbi:hypothetical protein [Flavobacterium sp.]|uniref:hypothetical protein n=1 Tax=Flavobacterium sp. TaxID=239 RepID=UPI0040481B61